MIHIGRCSGEIIIMAEQFGGLNSWCSPEEPISSPRMETKQGRRASAQRRTTCLDLDVDHFAEPTPKPTKKYAPVFKRALRKLRKKKSSKAETKVIQLVEDFDDEDDSECDEDGYGQPYSARESIHHAGDDSSPGGMFRRTALTPEAVRRRTQTWSPAQVGGLPPCPSVQGWCSTDTMGPDITDSSKFNNLRKKDQVLDESDTESLASKTALKRSLKPIFKRAVGKIIKKEREKKPTARIGEDTAELVSEQLEHNIALLVQCYQPGREQQKKAQQDVTSRKSFDTVDIKHATQTTDNRLHRGDNKIKAPHRNNDRNYENKGFQSEDVSNVSSATEEDYDEDLSVPITGTKPGDHPPSHAVPQIYLHQGSVDWSNDVTHSQIAPDLIGEPVDLTDFSLYKSKSEDILGGGWGQGGVPDEEYDSGTVDLNYSWSHTASRGSSESSMGSSNSRGSRKHKVKIGELIDNTSSKVEDKHSDKGKKGMFKKVFGRKKVKKQDLVVHMPPAEPESMKQAVGTVMALKKWKRKLGFKKKDKDNSSKKDGTDSSTLSRTSSLSSLASHVQSRIQSRSPASRSPPWSPNVIQSQRGPLARSSNRQRSITCPQAVSVENLPAGMGIGKRQVESMSSQGSPGSPWSRRWNSSHSHSPGNSRTSTPPHSDDQRPGSPPSEQGKLDRFEVKQTGPLLTKGQNYPSMLPTANVMTASQYSQNTQTKKAGWNQRAKPMAITDFDVSSETAQSCEAVEATVISPGYVFGIYDKEDETEEEESTEEVFTKEDVSTAATRTDVSTAATRTDVSTAATRTDVSTAATRTDVSTAATRTDVSTAATSTDVSTAATRTDVSPAATRTDVSTAATRTDVSPAATRTDVSTAATRTDVSTAATRTDVSTAATSTDVSTAATRTDVSTAATRTDVSPAATRTDVSTAATRTDVSPAATRTDVSTAATRTDVSTAATRTDVSTAATRTDVSTAATRTDVSTAATRTDVSTAATRTDVSTAATRTDVSTAATRTDVSTAATRTDVSTAATRTVIVSGPTSSTIIHNTLECDSERKPNSTFSSTIFSRKPSDPLNNLKTTKPLQTFSEGFCDDHSTSSSSSSSSEEDGRDNPPGDLSPVTTNCDESKSRTSPALSSKNSVTVTTSLIEQGALHGPPALTMYDGSEGQQTPALGGTMYDGSEGQQTPALGGTMYNGSEEQQTPALGGTMYDGSEGQETPALGGTMYDGSEGQQTPALGGTMYDGSEGQQTPALGGTMYDGSEGQQTPALGGTMYDGSEGQQTRAEEQVNELVKVNVYDDVENVTVFPNKERVLTAGDDEADLAWCAAHLSHHMDSDLETDFLCQSCDQ